MRSCAHNLILALESRRYRLPYSLRKAEFAGVLSTSFFGILFFPDRKSANSLRDKPICDAAFKKKPSIEMDGVLTIACHMKKIFRMLLE
jgi:hypothetical protein